MQEKTSVKKNTTKMDWLLDEITPKFTTSKLPSEKCVLNAVLHNILFVKKSVTKSANDVAGRILDLWNIHGMPCIEKDKIVIKLKRLHHTYKMLQKRKSRNTKSEELKVMEFKSRIRKLFDVAHVNFELLVSSNQLKVFLKDQRTKRHLKLQYIKDEKAITQKRYHKKIVIDDVVVDDCQLNSNQQMSDNEDEDFASLIENNKNVGKPLSNPSNLINEILEAPIVTSAIDRVGLTDEKFRLIMGPIASVLKANPSTTRLSRSTIKRKRNINRKSITQTIKDSFISQSALKKFIVHWDGKLLADLTNSNYALKKHKVDRIAVAVSGNGTSKLLGIPRVDNGSGFRIASAVFEEIKEWEMRKNVVGVCCDTTSSNTGCQNGANALLQADFLKQELIFFPCRHHIYEIIIGAVFTEIFGPCTGPNIQLFVDFQYHWNDIPKMGDHQSLPESKLNSPLTKRLRAETIECLQSLLAEKSNYIPRDDYRELIDLTLIILGVENPTYKLKIPGGLHHARWMCKVIYAFKMYLLHKQLPMSHEFYETLEAFCLFSSLLYVKQWLTCTLLLDAAVNDLQFYKNLVSYAYINHGIAHCALRKLEGQLWYLGPELVTFALFSDKVSVSDKREMIEKMKKCDGHWQRSLIPKHKQLHHKEISDLITSRSLFSLNKLNSSTFKFMLHNDPTVWTTCLEFQQLQHFVSKLNIVNDVAERAVARMTTYNSSLTYNEEEKQRILQITEDHCSRFSRKTKKVDLMKQ